MHTVNASSRIERPAFSLSLPPSLMFSRFGQLIWRTRNGCSIFRAGFPEPFVTAIEKYLLAFSDEPSADAHTVEPALRLAGHIRADKGCSFPQVMLTLHGVATYIATSSRLRLLR